MYFKALVRRWREIRTEIKEVPAGNFRNSYSQNENSAFGKSSAEVI